MKITVVGLALAWLCTAAAGAENRIVGPSGGAGALREAIEQARDGDTIDILPGTYDAEPLLIAGRRLTIRGVGPRPVFKAGPKPTDAKAIWTVRGGEMTIDNIEFRGARATDADGAGVRLEGGKLRLVDCAFLDDEHGVLATNDAGAELTIEESMFAEAPKVVGGLAHLLQVGRIARLTVTGSRFHQGFEGHLIKSGARENRIAYNLIHDGDGRASYEVDLPNGGLAWLVGNVIGQSPQSQNPVLVAYGAEGRAWDRNALYMAHNTLINQRWLPAWFLRVFRDKLPPSTTVDAVNNLTIGVGFFEWGASGHFSGNEHGWSSTLADPSTLAYELPPASALRGRGVDPRNVDGQDLSPKAEFKLPLGTRALPPATRWAPGAFQR